MLLVIAASKSIKDIENVMPVLKNEVKSCNIEKLGIIGPADAPVSKINDIYRKVMYIKHEDYDVLVRIKDRLDDLIHEDRSFSNVNILYDFNPE